MSSYSIQLMPFSMRFLILETGDISHNILPVNLLWNVIYTEVMIVM
jgi:hypothetical protein